MAGMLSRGMVSARRRRGRSTLSGVSLVVGFQSSGLRQRSHQMLMPGLGCRQAGHATGVPIAFTFEPSLGNGASSVL